MLRRTLGVGAALMILAAGNFGLRAHSAEALGANKEELKYEAPTNLAGAIYARGTGSKKLLFKFKRVATRSGATLNVQRDYTYPDGKLAARERVVYEGDNLVSFALEDLQAGGGGSARIRRTPGNPAKGTVEFTCTNGPPAKRRPQVHTEALAENTLMSDMVAPFLVSHWDGLMRGEKIRCRYLVVPRAETVGFTFSRASESTWQGRAVVIVKMAATSVVVGAMVDPLFFTMEKAPPHHVLEYTGRTTPRIQSGGKWTDLDAVTVFDW